jgi:hypothetical protein
MTSTRLQPDEELFGIPGRRLLDEIENFAADSIDLHGHFDLE